MREQRSAGLDRVCWESTQGLVVHNNWRQHPVRELIETTPGKEQCYPCPGSDPISRTGLRDPGLRTTQYSEATPWSPSSVRPSFLLQDVTIQTHLFLSLDPVSSLILPQPVWPRGCQLVFSLLPLWNNFFFFLVILEFELFASQVLYHLSHSTSSGTSFPFIPSET
jgi:hypothetical protein